MINAHDATIAAKSLRGTGTRSFRARLTQLSKAEQNGFPEARAKREAMNGRFRDAVRNAHQVVDQVKTTADDLRLATNVLKHRIRSFDAPDGSATARACELVRMGTDPARLDQIAQTLAEAADEGHQIAASALVEMKTTDNHVCATAALITLQDALAENDFQIERCQTERKAYHDAVRATPKENP